MAMIQHDIVTATQQQVKVGFTKSPSCVPTSRWTAGRKKCAPRPKGTARRARAPSAKTRFVRSREIHVVFGSPRSTPCCQIKTVTETRVTYELDVDSVRARSRFARYAHHVRDMYGRVSRVNPLAVLLRRRPSAALDSCACVCVYPGGRDRDRPLHAGQPLGLFH